jgi:hypothetical protein
MENNNFTSIIPPGKWQSLPAEEVCYAGQCAWLWHSLARR